MTDDQDTGGEQGGAAAERPVRRVALLIETSNGYSRKVLAGVYEHMRAGGHWATFLQEHGRGAPPLKELSRWKGDGIIARIETPETARVIEKLQIPTIDISAGRLLPNVPYVETDDAQIAGLAARHFLDNGFQWFAYCGDRRFQWSENRRRHFREALAEIGHDVHVFDEPATGPTDSEETLTRIGAWLLGLPKPVAVFACYDERGRQVIDECHRVGLRIPEDVAVLGVDDDELLCSLMTPPLSSVIPDARGAGWLAGELLDRLIDGEDVGIEHLLPPLGVAARSSTDVLAVDDPLIAAAVAHIRANVHRGIKPEDVVAAVGSSRNVLDLAFVRRLDRTLHEAIQQVQFRMVEQLLCDTDLKLAAVAARCGFKHPEYMTVAFTKRHGISPSEWRKLHRRG
ncbi:MAG: substrate-binding domain-containing protein [Pirellulales bacterium]